MVEQIAMMQYSKWRSDRSVNRLSPRCKLRRGRGFATPGRVVMCVGCMGLCIQMDFCVIEIVIDARW